MFYSFTLHYKYTVYTVDINGTKREWLQADCLQTAVVTRSNRHAVSAMFLYFNILEFSPIYIKYMTNKVPNQVVTIYPTSYLGLLQHQMKNNAPIFRPRSSLNVHETDNQLTSLARKLDVVVH